MEIFCQKFPNSQH